MEGGGRRNVKKLINSENICEVEMMMMTSQSVRWEELAETANYNARELARLCNRPVRQLEWDSRRSLGRTPRHWLNERRIMAAQQQLLSGQPIKAVAYDIGFKQTSHFFRQFKSLNRNVGMK
jgi:AraC-like DNA-binding protein